MLKLEKGRPADCAGRLEKEVRTYDFLDKLNIEYERIDHEAAPPVFCKRDVYGGVFRHHARVGQRARSDERQGTPCPASGGPRCAEGRLHRMPSVHQHVQPSHTAERYVGKNCSGVGTSTGLCDIGRTTGVSRYGKENADK